MAFFTDMKRSLTETGKQVAQKTKELSDTVQLKTQLSREKEALNRQYAQIGKKVFEAANGADEETYTAEFTLIRESLKTIDELQDKLSTLEGFIHCPECGAKIEKASAFCSKCGAKIAETKPEDDDIDVVDTAEASETTGEEKADGTCTCEAVPDESLIERRSTSPFSSSITSPCICPESPMPLISAASTPEACSTACTPCTTAFHQSAGSCSAQPFCS